MKSFLIGAGIIGSGLLIAVLLGVFAPEPEKSDPPPTAPLVSTAPVEVQTGALRVTGTGTVRPTDEVTLTAEVGGRIVSTSDALVSGGRFQAGQTLAQIDPSDYRNAVRQAEAQVTQAEFAVIQAREEVTVAKDEYERIKERTGRAPSPDSTSLGASSSANRSCVRPRQTWRVPAPRSTTPRRVCLVLAFRFRSTASCASDRPRSGPTSRRGRLSPPCTPGMRSRLWCRFRPGPRA